MWTHTVQTRAGCGSTVSLAVMCTDTHFLEGNAAKCTTSFKYTETVRPGNSISRTFNEITISGHGLISKVFNFNVVRQQPNWAIRVLVKWAVGPSFVRRERVSLISSTVGFPSVLPGSFPESPWLVGYRCGWGYQRPRAWSRCVLSFSLSTWASQELGTRRVVCFKLSLRWVLPVYEQRDRTGQPRMSLLVKYASQFSFN